ncbi:DUF5753 domain-containing protein [Salinispora arenicola]|uniref:DUF5753 domain-containing protein n=1 Tax=Salinispora arenicola TaxID=168697 RepID=UPI00037C342C|nr:DUF5753 domain-containing protein [Salinispora arenicola]
MTGLPGPSLCRRRLRTQLTCLRRQHHRLTDAQISAEMDWSVSKTRRLFAGDVSFSRADLRQILTLLGLTDPDRINELLFLAQKARQPHWAARYRRALSSGQMEMLGWEDDAARVIQYHPYLLPDLVRTEDYAHAAMAADPWHRSDPKAIDERVAALMARQQRVNHAGRCVTILADARAMPACDSQMMRQQRDRLKALPPHIDLRILPRDREILSCLSGPVTTHAFPDDPPAAYVGSVGDDVRVIERPDLTAQYGRLLTDLYQHSHPALPGR